MTSGERIRIQREKIGLSLNKLAKKANISPAYLSALENDKQSDPSLSIAHKLATALETTIGYLFEGVETKQTCENCFFFAVNVFDENVCRRFPPQYVGESKHKWLFPPVNNWSWCGEWKPKVNA